MQNDKVKEILINAAYRWLNRIDLRIDSNTFGICDREYWAWKTKDFANGTMQSGLSGFLDISRDLELSKKDIKYIISATVNGTKLIQRSNGSFEEAYPYESSYAVTGLVLFNLLYSMKKYKQFFDHNTLEILRKIADKSYVFLCKNTEKHGVISNHLCSSIMAMQMYENIFNSETQLNPRTLNFLKLQHDDEGWFPEYDGADPGYQSLLNHYLSTYHNLFPSPQVQSVLEKSFDFVEGFLYPDYSFAGEIGSRGTRILYPSGIDLSIVELTPYLLSKDSTSPIVVDEGNFVPVFNSWARLLVMNASDRNIKYPKSIYYKNANLYLVKSEDAYLVVNLKNGTFLNSFFNNGQWSDYSVVAIKKGQYFSQLSTISKLNIKSDYISFNLNGGRIKQMNNSAMKSVIIRIVGMILYISLFLQNLWKWLLAKTVMGQKDKKLNLNITVELDLHLQDRPKLTGITQDHSIIKRGFYKHMASANTFTKRFL